MIINGTITQVIAVFMDLSSPLATSSTRLYLYQATVELVKLQNEALSDEEFKNKANLLMVGVMIGTTVVGDNIRLQTGGACKYPKSFDEVFFNTQEMTLQEQLIYIGTRALIDKTLPFTSRFDTFCGGIFSSLDSILPADYFDCYQLNMEQSRNALKISNQPYQALLKINKEMEEDWKWKSPFGLSPGYKGARFEQRRKELKDLINKEERRYLFLILKLSALTLRTLVSSMKKTGAYKLLIPQLLTIFKGIQEEYRDKTWVITQFTREEYDAVCKQRQALKALFVQPVITSPDKPHKVCIGLDAKGKETKNRRDIKTVVMFSDKAQALRWSPNFLKQATYDSYNNLINKSVSLNPETTL